MKTLLSVAVFLVAAPLVAADVAPVAPPVPPPVSYNVWGFKWDGGRYVRQPNYDFTTTDLDQAADYANRVRSYRGWTATTNIPQPGVGRVMQSRWGFRYQQPPAPPNQPTYSVWAFKLTDGKWVKDEQYSWTTGDPGQGLAYANRVNAVPGWKATTNSPPSLPTIRQYVNGAAVSGGAGDSYIQLPTICINGWTVRLPSLRIPAGVAVGDEVDSTGLDDSLNDANWRAIQDSVNLQNMLNTQDMINTQMMNNNIQDMINTQNFINTENMINTQNAVNAQMNP